MKNIFFDVCAIPFYLLILWTCHVRKLTKGRANRVFITMTCMSLVCAVADLWMEYVVNPVPLSSGAVVLGAALSYTYKFFRSVSLVVYFIYIFMVTRTDYRLQTLRSRVFLWLPNIVMTVVLFQNLITHNVFIVTAEGGYSRGPMLTILYAGALLYALAGTGYCIYCKRYLVSSKWVALISVYVLIFVGVFIQLRWPHYAVEMFSTAIGLMFIMLLIMRPEESLDGKGIIQDWRAYGETLQRTIASGARFQVVVVQLMNALEIRRYIGDGEFHGCIETIADEISKLYSSLRVHIDLFFEIPGSFYLLIDDGDIDVPGLVPQFNEDVAARMEAYVERGIHFDFKYCVIKCPEDMKSCQDILRLGHTFSHLGRPAEIYRARDLLHERDYGPMTNIKDILDRAITEGTLEMYYQPIYDIRAGQFHSAEALARLKDTVYGMVSPGIFIPAAEQAGMMLPLGEKILELVFRFISENDLASLGLSYIEINLSVAQCLQRELPETIRRLQRKYGVDPRQVNFEVTETQFDNLSDIMNRNLHELAEMGYTFSLDDYGVGYSNIQRLKTLPLKIIKLDKSLVDDMFTEAGEVIIENTVRMMRGIHKELVVEGVETREAVEACGELACDYIQGYYFSRPLPEKEFVAFVRAHNNVA